MTKFSSSRIGAASHAMLPKQYGAEYSMKSGVIWQTAILYTDGGKDFVLTTLQQIGVQLGFVCHLRDRPSEGGIVELLLERSTQSCFQPTWYTGSNVQKRPEEAEQEACLTLRQPEQQLVRYIVDNHNRELMLGWATRQGFKLNYWWLLDVISERDLDICLMKQNATSKEGLFVWEPS